MAKGYKVRDEVGAKGKTVPQSKSKNKAAKLKAEPRLVVPPTRGKRIRAMPPSPLLAHIPYFIPGGTSTPPHNP